MIKRIKCKAYCYKPGKIINFIKKDKYYILSGLGDLENRVKNIENLLNFILQNSQETYLNVDSTLQSLGLTSD